MKVKLKITVGQFAALLGFVRDTKYEGLEHLQVLNCKAFVSFGLKKLIDFQYGYATSYSKTKTFNIEINQYNAIMSLLNLHREHLQPYDLAIFVTLQNQTRNLLTLN